MRHAGAATLERLEPLLAEIRALGGGLVERKRGIWYRRGRAFLHLHEDGDGAFADLRTGVDFERFRVETRAERLAFVRRVGALLDVLDEG